ncbi:amino acid aminotransferase [Marinomonas mediterranea]|jgi:Aspartate/tyrosine/aromatic aminotransferase|uniref:Aspartate transaminase n=1 Tax=Marinomonas mediterranea (strain ATCC 700492 / JCM 21426 / NBRC 103028 / MMB-1) TaxID=717774 RepID=F2K4A6_MARM1|nr:amino acid aminotransferase [Marinomonas mediterranea]ADZ92547.1 Aspartate transaminase [Marinomonas mediterranea MMB-1]WCN18592.1 aminotransferase class I/II-fold pyridoxal phosphate-dependent enzyme [Marinomonas mediterranea MMB-1]
MFKHLKAVPGDPLLALIVAHQQDTNPKKIDLGVGVYKNDSGQTPILESVKKAEAFMVENEITKSYLGVYGAPEFSPIIQDLLLGKDSNVIKQGRIQSTQTPGGTGALKVAADFISANLDGARLWVSDPTWGNHQSIFNSAGVEVITYPYYDAVTNGVRFEEMMATLEAETTEGDVLLLHACCHNPTGVDLNLEHWEALTELVNKRNLLPLIDAAYQGFGDGLEEDMAGLRYMAERVPSLLVANSFSKNFGIYRDRCGGLSVIAETAEEAKNAFSIIGQAIRANYSMPPAHGATLVHTIMTDPDLKALWETEVTQMRDRINDLRSKLVQKLAASGASKDFSFIEQQRGMFSYSGLSLEQVRQLRSEYSIYIADSGRMSIAGISDQNIDYLSESIAKVVG